MHLLIACAHNRIECLTLLIACGFCIYVLFLIMSDRNIWICRVFDIAKMLACLFYRIKTPSREDMFHLQNNQNVLQDVY